MNHLKFYERNVLIIESDILIIIGFSKGIKIFAEEKNIILNDSNFYRCIDPLVKILVNTPHTIIFAVDDVSIHRVEFLIRRCHGVRI